MQIEIEHLCKVLEREEVLKDLTFRMESGTIYGIKGKNGSGKTMLLRAICGLIRPTSGTVKINGEIIGKDITFPRSVGALIENPGFISNISGYDNLKMLADIKGAIKKDEIEDSMVRVGLDQSAWKKKYRKYSLGMKQKLGIAAAIMEHPDLIILDEPTNALDEESVERLRLILQEEKKRGGLILIASHDMEELNLLSDQIIVMENGKIRETVSEEDS